MAKRQNFVVGSTNQVTESLTNTELNNGWDQYDILGAGKLDGVFNSVSDYSKDSSNEIANAIQSITGSEPTGNSQSELAGALQQMRNEIETTSLTFVGYVATSAPSSSTYSLVEGNLWINSATMPTSFPVAASNIKKWDGSAWVAYGSTYTPKDFDFFRNINDNEGYYWFGGQWTVMSTDMSTTYFTLNQGTGKWEIKSSVNLPGNPTTTTAGANDDSTKIATTAWVNTNCGADKDMTKLTSVGKNISNWSSNVTNCITEIPQDLKIELNNGTFTLKAASKVYVPNGNGVFNTVITSSDLSITPSGFSTSSNRMIICNPNGTIGMLDVYLPYVYSGTTAPTTFDGSGRAFWYDTANNSIKKTNDSGSTWVDGYGFPIALVHITNGVGVDEIEQLFNGIGFIGRTLYVLPGVKALHSNGFNSDGTLKNDITTVSSVLTYTGGISDNLGQIILNKNGTSCQFGPLTTSWKYDIIRNIFYWSNNNDTNWINIGTYYYDTTEKYMTQFNPKLAFHAVDYSDYSKLVSDVDTKANDNAVVKLTGNQVIGGTKTFSAAAYGQASAVINSLLTTSGLFKQSGFLAGYVKLGNGIIIQWGRSSIDSTLPTQPTNVNIVFPYAFSSNTSYSVTANNYMNVNFTGGYNVGIDSLTSTGFTYRSCQASNNIVNNVFWVAIGF